MDPFGRPLQVAKLLPLPTLIEAAQFIESGLPLPRDLEAFYDQASSLGGARPKASLLDNDGAPWIAKFPSRDDTFDEVRVEAACLDMAEAAGIDTPEHQVIVEGGVPVLVVKRFDRILQDGVLHRLGNLSAETALGVDGHSYVTGKSYGDLGDATHALGSPAGPEVFRRMIFNVLIGNTDDHLRNHAFLRWMDGQWRLSPVYDLVPQPGRRDMVLKLNKGHSVDLEDALSSSGRFGIGREEALEIWWDVAQVVGRWRTFMKRRHVTETDMDIIAPAFARAPRDALLDDVSAFAGSAGPLRP